MKKIIKNNIFGFILGILLTGVAGVFAYSYIADQISYTTSKNESVKSVGQALNDLYDKADNNGPSSLIKNVDFEITDVSSFQATINYTYNGSASDIVLAYAIINNEIVATSKTNSIVIKDLEKRTEYNVYVQILDKSGKLSRKTEVKKFTTKNSDILYDGSKGVNLLGSIEQNGFQNQYLKLESTYIYGYNTATGSYSNKMFWFSNNLSLQNYTKLYITLKIVSKTAFAIGITSTTAFNNAVNDATALSNFNNGAGANITSDQLNKTVTLEIDISNVNSGHFGTFMCDTKGYIYSVWVE